MTFHNATFLEKSKHSGGSSSETKVSEEEQLEQATQPEQKKSNSSHGASNSNKFQDVPPLNMRRLRSREVVMVAAWITEVYKPRLDGNIDAQDTVLRSPHRECSVT